MTAPAITYADFVPGMEIRGGTVAYATPDTVYVFTPSGIQAQPLHSAEPLAWGEGTVCQLPAKRAKTRTGAPWLAKLNRLLAEDESTGYARYFSPAPSARGPSGLRSPAGPDPFRLAA